MTLADRPGIHEQFEAASSKVARLIPGLADERWETTPEEIGAWLLSAEAAALAGGYIPRPKPGDPEATTLYIEASDDGVGGDLGAICFGPPVDTAPDEFEAVVGDELGDLRLPRLELVGMAATQEWLSKERPEADPEQSRAVDAFVRLALFDIVDRARAVAKASSLRLVARRHEDPTICVWELDEAGASRATILQVD